MTQDALQPEGGWSSLARARLSAPVPAARGLLFRSTARLSGLFGRQEVPDVLTVLHLNPRLFWAWLFFASRLMPYGKLPPTLREKIILRTAWNCRSRYEWGQHVDIALRAGVSDADIVRLSQGPQACTSPHEQAVLQACDELCRHTLVSDDTWQRLSQHYPDSLLIEILLLVGHYQMIAGFLNSAGLTLEAPIEKTLQAFYRRISC